MVTASQKETSDVSREGVAGEQVVHTDEQHVGHLVHTHQANGRTIGDFAEHSLQRTRNGQLIGL